MAKCPKCGTNVASPAKTWPIPSRKATGRGEDSKLVVGIFECPSCSARFRAAVDVETKDEEKVYKKYENYEKVDIKGVTEEMFPQPIKKLLRGLKDGKKRGLFILITFLRSLNFPPDYINQKVRDWNKLNEPQLKEGYIRSQIDWHLKQKRNILPPNYDNPGFYKDLGLLDGKPEVKNPIVEVIRRIKNKQKQ